MDKSKQRGTHAMLLKMPIEEAEAIQRLAQSVGLKYTGILRFLIRDALADPDATCQKIKERQQNIKALGGKL